MKPINERISENITALRKAEKLTQLEFAEKINYSDKAVSRWENGDSIPSIEVLEKICQFFNVTLNDITSDKPIRPVDQTKEKKRLSTNKVLIICLSMLFVILLATILFVYAKLIFNYTAWIVFVWAVPVCCVIGIIFNCIWWRKENVSIFISLFVWTLLASIYLTFLRYNAWVIFILGVPIQISIILWNQIDGAKHKARVAKMREEKRQEEEQSEKERQEKLKSEQENKNDLKETKEGEN